MGREGKGKRKVSKTCIVINHIYITVTGAVDNSFITKFVNTDFSLSCRPPQLMVLQLGMHADPLSSLSPSWSPLYVVYPIDFSFPFLDMAATPQYIYLLLQ
jgi:hypothetical protein